jgi:hypothetical protein
MTSPLIAPRPEPAGECTDGAAVTAQAAPWTGRLGSARTGRVAEPAGGRWRPTSMRPYSLTVRVRAWQVAAAVVAVATACGTGVSAGHATAAGHGHRSVSGRPAAVSDGIAGARHRGAAPQRWILPCRPAGGTRRVAATACRVAPWRIMCPMAAAGSSHPAHAIVSRPGCRLFCWAKAGALARCGSIWGCWGAGQQAGPGLLCAEGTRSPQHVTPGRAAAAGRPPAAG